MMFQLMSTQPEYSQIIRPFIALAPVAYVGAIESIILRLGALLEPLLRFNMINSISKMKFKLIRNV